MSDLLTRLEAMKATDRKAEAISAYETACEAPETADWQTIAHALRRVLPNPRKLPVADTGDDGGTFAAWYEGKRRPSGGSGKDFGSVRAEITFADGRIVRAYALTYKGSAPDIAGACRSACDLWRYKTQPGGYEWRATVPEIVRAYIPETGTEYDPARASAYTADKRAPDPEKVPSLDAIKRRYRTVLAWFEAPGVFLPHGGASEYRKAALEYVWPPIRVPLCEEMPEAPEPLPEAMPEPVRPVSDLARKLLSSALSSPTVAAMPATCAIMVKPPRVLAFAA